MVAGLVKQFLAEDGRHALDLVNVTRDLRAHGEVLKRHGVTGLWIFGSVACGDAGTDSGVDLVAEFDRAVHPSIVELVSLRAELSDFLGAQADLLERGTLRSVRRRATRERLEDVPAATEDALVFARDLDAAGFTELSQIDRRTYRALR